MAKLGIVADDLTGANDTGVQFAKAGLKTLVLWDLKGAEETSESYDIVVVDTESRGLPMKEAYGRAFAAAKTLEETGAPRFYKKIDSTIRGNIGAELDGVLDALGISLAVVCPAYPKNRRVVVEGHLLVGDTPVEMTEIGHDPIAPVANSHIPTLIREQSTREVYHIPRAKVLDGPQPIASIIRREHEKGASVFIVDAASEDDLRTIVQGVSSLEEEVLLCGSAGLAEEIPHSLGLLPRKGSVLVLAGTASTVTTSQIDALQRTTRAMVITVDAGEMFGDEEQRAAEILRVQDASKDALAEGRDVVIRWARSNQEAEEVKRLSNVSDRRGLSQIVLSTFSTIASVLVSRDLSGLVLTGGDTAMSVINALKAGGIHVVGEVEAGVPATTIVGGPWEGLRVVTKAGAFGDDLTLTRAIHYLRWKT